MVSWNISVQNAGRISGVGESNPGPRDFIASDEASECVYEFRPFTCRSFTYTANRKS